MFYKSISVLVKKRKKNDTQTSLYFSIKDQKLNFLHTQNVLLQKIKKKPNHVKVQILTQVEQ